MYYDQVTYLIRPTNHCFLNCDYCMVKDQLSASKINELPSDLASPLLVSTLFQKSIGFGSIFMTFVGGEPMMAGKEWFRKAFAIIRKESEQHKISATTRIYTNGLLLDDEWVELFAENNCQIYISWDGLGFGKKGSKKAYDLICKYSKNIAAVTPVITEANHTSLIDIFNQVQAASIKRMSCQFDIYANKSTMIKFGNEACKLFSYIESLERPKTRFMLYHDIKALATGKGKITSNEISAAVVNSDFVINPDGEIILGLPQDSDEAFRLGNIYKHRHINDAIFSPKMKQVNDDYVSSQRLIGEYELTNKLTRGGGFFFDKKEIQDMNRPFMNKLACYKVLLDYFGAN